MNNRAISVSRYVAGYVLGIGVFLVLIPYVLWRLSAVEHFIFEIPILPFNCARITLSALLLMIGAVFVLWSNVFLVLRGKGGPTDVAGVSISPQTVELVVDGPYRYTRNPMVFGANSIYVSIAIYLNSLGCLAVLFVFFITFVKLVIRSEERRLLKDFGDDYEEYRDRTAMIIPWLGRKASED